MSIFKICHFFLKTHNDVPKSFGFPWVECLLLLWKTKTAWIKRSIHYVTLQCYNSGEATHKISSLPPESWPLIQKRHIWQWQCLRKKNGSRIKTPSSNSKILVSICWRRKKNCLQWIKRSIHYVTLQCYNSGASYSQNFLPTSWIVTFDTKEAHLTMTVPQKKKRL